MEIIAIKKIVEQVEKNNTVALVTVVSVEGVVPSKLGMNMAVLNDASTAGTVGGGTVEHEITKIALEKMNKEEDTLYSYKKKDLKIDFLIKIFRSREKLIIVGAGHVGFELYKIANLQKFYTVIVDPRSELNNRDRFTEADEIYLGDIGEVLSKYKIDDKCYVVACGPNHNQDEMTIRKCIDRGAKYIGMLGSRKKISSIKIKLRDEGISNESLNKIYSPIGINIGGDSLAEIAFGIFGEILAIKNNSQINHMKDMKK